MSDMISAWVDQNEMRRLAESLISGPHRNELSHLEVDFGSQFEGFAGGVPDASDSKGHPSVNDKRHAVAQTSQESAAPRPEVRTSHPKVDKTQREGKAPQTGAVEQPGAVVRSAVQFLKRAQAEGRAGGVIREPKEEPLVPSSSPVSAPEEREAEPSQPGPSQAESRPIYSPFRRLSEVELETTEEKEPLSAEGHFSRNPLKRPPVPSADDPILTRVTHFGKWLKGPVGARNYFVSNLEGKILIDELVNPKLIEVARSLAEASQGSDGEVGSLHVRIGEDSILEVVPTPSQFGTLILGLIVEHSLPEELIREIRLGLEEVANARLLKSQGQRR